MKALVISGGGSKGAFAGGVASYLIKDLEHKYDIFVGTSTGSLLLPYLVLGELDALKELYTNVGQEDIFSVSPFRVKNKNGYQEVSINHINVLRNFLRGKKTFGDSSRLKKLIKRSISKERYEKLKDSGKDIVITVSNLTLNRMEYPSVATSDYETFCEWLWASCNYAPFMSVLEKNGCQYADGGFGSLVPIKEAINRGATEIDAIILDTDTVYTNKIPAKNPFSLITDIFEFVQLHIKKHNISIGKLASRRNQVKLNLYYTPVVLTSNSLIFNKKKMKKWWEIGYNYAKDKQNKKMSDVDFNDK